MERLNETCQCPQCLSSWMQTSMQLSRPAIRGLNVAKYYQPHDAPCCLDVVPPLDWEMKSLCGKDVKPVLTLQHLENVQRAALAQVAVASQNEVFGDSIAAHLSSFIEGLSEGLKRSSRLPLQTWQAPILRMSVKTRSMRSTHRGWLWSP